VPVKSVYHGHWKKETTLDKLYKGKKGNGLKRNTSSTRTGKTRRHCQAEKKNVGKGRKRDDLQSMKIGNKEGNTNNYT